MPPVTRSASRRGLTNGVKMQIDTAPSEGAAEDKPPSSPQTPRSPRLMSFGELRDQLSHLHLPEQLQHLHIPHPHFHIPHPHHVRKSVVLLLLAFAAALGALFLGFQALPDSEHLDDFKVPRSIKDIKVLRGVLASYKEDYYIEVVLGFCSLYIFMQSFAIPGSMFLSVLAGALFGFWLGFALVITSATVGATLCYMIAYHIARPIVVKLFHKRLVQIVQKVREQKDDLFSWLLFLRISPLLPNWFINITSPVLEIPLRTFALATFFGIVPASVIAVRAGLTLSELQTVSDILGPKMILILLLLAFAALVPAWAKKKLRQREARAAPLAPRQGEPPEPSEKPGKDA